ncbi:hypothetical protein [Paeniglutamicibacter sp. NPDC091659]|uniref:hypothetical protein n=1 Tax=Paeniglutamicibacter sp. NPDC091659 TaxID=3364389 RepID=UPI0038008C7C
MPLRIDLCRLGENDRNTPRLWEEIRHATWVDERTVSKRAAFARLGRGSTAGYRLIDAGVLPLRSVQGYKDPRVPESVVEFLEALPHLDAESMGGYEASLQFRCIGATVRGDATEALGEPESELAKRIAAQGVPTRAAKFYGLNIGMNISQAVNSTCGWWSMGPKVAGAPSLRSAVLHNYRPPFERVLVTVAGLALLDLQTTEIVCRSPGGGSERTHGVVIHAQTPKDLSLVGTWIADPPDGRTLRRFGKWPDRPDAK